MINTTTNINFLAENTSSGYNNVIIFQSISANQTECGLFGGVHFKYNLNDPWKTILGYVWYSNVFIVFLDFKQVE